MANDFTKRDARLAKEKVEVLAVQAQAQRRLEVRGESFRGHCPELFKDNKAAYMREYMRARRAKGRLVRVANGAGLVNNHMAKPPLASIEHRRLVNETKRRVTQMPFEKLLAFAEMLGEFEQDWADGVNTSQFDDLF